MCIFKNGYFSENSKITEICDDAFNSSGIECIQILDNLTVIGCNAFFKCEKLKTVKIIENSKLTKICKSAFENTGIENFFIPSEVTLIEKLLFVDCYQMKTITFSEDSKLTELPNFTLSNSSIKYVVFPKSVASVGETSFECCEKLLCAEFLADFFTFGQLCFDGSENLFLVGFPNAKKVTCLAKSFNNVSKECSFFIPAKSKLIKNYQLDN